MFRKVMGVTPNVRLIDIDDSSVPAQEKARLILDVIGDGIRRLYEDGSFCLFSRRQPDYVESRARRLLDACASLELLNQRHERQFPGSGLLPVPYREIRALRSCIADFLPGERGRKQVHTVISWYIPRSIGRPSDLLVDSRGAMEQGRRLVTETVPGLCGVYDAKTRDMGGAHLLLDHDADVIVTGFPYPKMGMFEYHVVARGSAPRISEMPRLDDAMFRLGLFPHASLPSYENRLALPEYSQAV